MPDSGFKGEMCGALTRRGTACQQPAMKNGRCRMHGGKTPRGVDLPHFQHGRYSKSVPDRLSTRYEEALLDRDRHDLRDEIALATTKLADTLRKMEHGESDSLWLLLRAKEREMRRASTRGEDEGADQLLREILTLILDVDEALAWNDLDKWLARKQRIVEADMRIAVTKQQMISIEEVMALMGMIMSTIKRHVQDAETRRVLAREIRAALDPENPGGAVISPRPL
jgi:hypothetical protein